MTTPPLDLPALRIDTVTASRFEIGSSSHPWSLVDPDHLVEAIDRAIAAEEEAGSLRSAVETSNDAWAALAARAEAAEAAVARVEALCQDTDGNWLDPEDECNNVGGILQAVRGGA